MFSYVHFNIAKHTVFMAKTLFKCMAASDG
jgi:hypothetical protein